MFEYIILAVALAVLVFIFSSFRPARTAKIDDNLYAVNCAMVNFYAYKNDGGIALFDAGLNPGMARRGFMRNSLKRPYKTIKDGETVRHGDASVTLILTPGHTPGSASYIIDGRVLVTGDLLRVTRGNIKPFLRLMNMDHIRDAKTIEAMRGELEQAEYILTGHTGLNKKG